MTHQRKDTIVFNSEEFVLLDTEDDKLIYDSFKKINEPVENIGYRPLMSILLSIEVIMSDMKFEIISYGDR